MSLIASLVGAVVVIMGSLALLIAVVATGHDYPDTSTEKVGYSVRNAKCFMSLIQNLPMKKVIHHSYYNCPSHELRLTYVL